MTRVISSKWTAVAGSIALVLLWVCIIVASGAGWNPWGVTWNFGNPGAFGDSFGPVSALMASLAAVSAIAAFRGQQAEINRLREREVKEDDRRTAENARIYARELVQDEENEKSVFEGTYFRLLEAFRSIVSETDIVGSSGRRVARDAFKAMVNYFQNAASIEDDRGVSWRQTATNYENDLNHYFRFMYHIVSFVHESKQGNKYFYVRLLRAHLSESEIILLALNCAYGEGVDKFKPLVERYALLHNVSYKARKLWKLDTLYEQSAFDSSPT